MIGLTPLPHSSLRFRSFCLLAVVATLPACSLDTRELEGTDSFAGSSPSGSAGGGGSSSGIANPGLNAPDPPPCAYVGSEVDAGCETLVANPGFDQRKGVLGWPPFNLAFQATWDERDATDGEDSGSMLVTNRLSADEDGETINGALQCVPATAGAVYDVVTDVFIPKQETEGRAGVVVLFYRSVDCRASNIGTDQSFTTKLVDKPEEWTTVAGRFIVPANMRSMEVTLVAGKSFRPASFGALFDNVLVQEK